MNYITKLNHALVYSGYRVYFDHLEYSCGTDFSSEVGAIGGIVHNVNGKKPIIITVKGFFQPSEITFISNLIKELSGAKNYVVIDGWSYSNFVLIEGNASLNKYEFLGTFSLKLGVLE